MLASPSFRTKIKHHAQSFPRLACAVRLIFSAILFPGFVDAKTVAVTVGPGANPHRFSPETVDIDVGDTVKWTWTRTSHSVTSGDSGVADGLFDSEIQNQPLHILLHFHDSGEFPLLLYCSLERTMVGTVNVTGGTPTPTPSPSPSPISHLHLRLLLSISSASPSPSPSPTPTPPAQSLNVSTRLDVGTGDKVSIGGIIITEGEAKRVLLRAIGPSLANFGITDPLPDPVLELHAGDGSLITSNDNWNSPPAPDIEATGLAPTNPLESAIIATLDPGLYTAVVNGKDGGTGVGLVEAYDLDQSASSQLGNLSTRGFVDIGNNVMIGGFILGPDDAPNANVLVRAIGPSLDCVWRDRCAGRSGSRIARRQRHADHEQR